MMINTSKWSINITSIGSFDVNFHIESILQYYNFEIWQIIFYVFVIERWNWWYGEIFGWAMRVFLSAK